MIYSTIVPIRAAPLSASQSDILLRRDTLQKEGKIFPQFVNWQSPINKIMLKTAPSCYFHSEGFNARVSTCKNIFIYLLHWSGHIEIRSHDLFCTLQQYYRLFKNCFIQLRDGFPGNKGKSSTSSL